MNRKNKAKDETRRKLCAAGCWLAMFALWTAAVCTVDVQAIGPQGSAVGLARVNGAFHSLTGVHMALYTITDWLSIVPAALATGFGLMGLRQLICRRSLWKVDADILALGVLYVVVLAAYALFELCPVNYRPVLIGGRLEASYPSSTALLVLCIMPTAAMQISARMRKGRFRRLAVCAMSVFAAMMIAGRLFSGVHWLSDIIGGALLSAGLVALYDSVCRIASGGK